MAIFRKVTKCLKGHPLRIWSGDDYQYFCKICGNIDIHELRWQIDIKIHRLNIQRQLKAEYA